MTPAKTHATIVDEAGDVHQLLPGSATLYDLRSVFFSGFDLEWHADVEVTDGGTVTHTMECDRTVGVMRFRPQSDENGLTPWQANVLYRADDALEHRDLQRVLVPNSIDYWNGYRNLTVNLREDGEPLEEATVLQLDVTVFQDGTGALVSPTTPALDRLELQAALLDDYDDNLVAMREFDGESTAVQRMESAARDLRELLLGERAQIVPTSYALVPFRLDPESSSLPYQIDDLPETTVVVRLLLAEKRAMREAIDRMKSEFDEEPRNRDTNALERAQNDLLRALVERYVVVDLSKVREVTIDL